MSDRKRQDSHAPQMSDGNRQDPRVSDETKQDLPAEMMRNPHMHGVQDPVMRQAVRCGTWHVEIMQDSAYAAPALRSYV